MFRYGASYIIVLGLCVSTLMKINIASANNHFDMTKLDDQTQKQIKAACYFQKIESSKVYADCLAKETRKAFSTNMQGLKTDALIVKSNKEICKGALSKKTGTWDLRASANTFVQRAKRRKLLPTDCAKMLNRTESFTTSKSLQIKTNKGPTEGSRFSNAKITEKFTDLKRTLKISKEENRNLKQKIKELKLIEERNLSSLKKLRIEKERLIEQARKAPTQKDVHRINKQPRTAKSKESIPFKNPPQKAEKKKKQLLSKNAEKVRRHLYDDICNQALKINMMTWDTGNPYSRRKVKEARNLGLSEQDCARILDRKEKTETGRHWLFGRKFTNISPTSTSFKLPGRKFCSGNKHTPFFTVSRHKGTSFGKIYYKDQYPNGKMEIKENTDTVIIKTNSFNKVFGQIRMYYKFLNLGTSVLLENFYIKKADGSYSLTPQNQQVWHRCD
jgi:hypothetical protein